MMKLVAEKYFSHWLLSQKSTIIYVWPTLQKIKFSDIDFFSKCDQIPRKLRIRPHLLKKSLMVNFIFCVVVGPWIQLWDWVQKNQKQPTEVLYKKGVLTKLTKFAGKHLCQNLLFNDFAGLRHATFFKKIGSGIGVFLWILRNF